MIRRSDWAACMNGTSSPSPRDWPASSDSSHPVWELSGQWDWHAHGSMLDGEQGKEGTSDALKGLSPIPPRPPPWTEETLLHLCYLLPGPAIQPSSHPAIQPSSIQRNTSMPADTPFIPILIIVPVSLSNLHSSLCVFAPNNAGCDATRICCSSSDSSIS